ncbi:permease family protein [Lactobacillus selangorensis]|uniref:Permease family protein n=2 Tax=Lactobacillus selangorensis TaxID=81857 RepID=A0A0R2G3R0_9LACO|nr:permease family protein [Lactobacillus selangorensis]KRN31930.1 permease family protein [Lactobacillus selangorensis]
MLYFVFTAMIHNADLKRVFAKIDHLYFENLLEFASLTLLLFMVFFLFYSNALFIKKRKREFGLYNLLGVSKRNIGLLFFSESLALGVIALVIGLTLGVLLSKLFAMLVLRMMQVHANTNFLFSWIAVRKTGFVFLGLFVLLGLLNGSLIYRYRLVDLFKPSEELKGIARPTKGTYLGAILSILMIATGYLISYQTGPTIRFSAVIGPNAYLLGMVPLILLLVVLGTYGFFKFFVEIVLHLAQRWRRFYYHGMRIVGISNLVYRVKRNANALWLSTILSAVTITAIGSASMVFTYNQDLIKGYAPQDVTALNGQYQQLQQQAQAAAVPLKDVHTTQLKTMGASFSLRSLLNQHQVNESGAATIVSQSAYNRINRHLANFHPVHLKGNQTVAILDFIAIFKGDAQRPRKRRPIPVRLRQANLPTLQLIGLSNQFPYGYGAFFGNGLVVSDQLFAQLQPDFTDTIYSADLGKSPNKSKLLSRLNQQSDQADHKEYLRSNGAAFNQRTYRVVPATQLKESERIGYNDRSTLLIQRPFARDSHASFGFLMYIVILLSLIFMLATGSIIMLKQLTEAQGEIGQYQTLKKIGVTTPEIRHSLYQQLLLVFLLPILVGTLHAYFVIHMLSFYLDNPSSTLAYVICGLYIVVYSGFYLLTARAYNRIVNRPIRTHSVY